MSSFSKHPSSTKDAQSVDVPESEDAQPMESTSETPVIIVDGDEEDKVEVVRWLVLSP